MRQVVVYPGEDGFWVAECPSLPGCVSQGESREQANIREAIEGYILARFRTTSCQFPKRISMPLSWRYEPVAAGFRLRRS